MKVGVVRTRLHDVPKAVEKFAKMRALVGIPAGSKGNQRKGADITNARLGWIHEKGSETAHIPPRPFLVPGTEEQAPKIAKNLAKAMRHALRDDLDRAEMTLEALAMDVAQGVQEYMEDSSHFMPLNPATVRNRWRKRGVKMPRWAETKEGMIWGALNRPLIDTAAMQQSIVGVVDKGE